MAKYFTSLLRSLVKYFSTLKKKFRISTQPCNIHYFNIAFTWYYLFFSILRIKFALFLKFCPKEPVRVFPTGRGMAFIIFKPFSGFFFIKMADITFIARTRRRLEKGEMIKWYTIFRLPVPNAGNKVYRNFGI